MGLAVIKLTRATLRRFHTAIPGRSNLELLKGPASRIAVRFPWKSGAALRLVAENVIEQVLLADPDVADALVADESDGRSCYQLAYVAVDSGRLAAAKLSLYHAERERRILQWRRAFDHVYRHGAGDFAPSFVGWNSNFTGQPISQPDMAEWLESTVARIGSLGAERILEVGCGVGLLLERLAPGCRRYCGTDLSPVAVHRLQGFIASKPELRHVELLEREATDFSDLADHSFDAVVINSVVQYFPSVDYLRDVLEQAARVVAPGGYILVGDVRNLSLLRAFHAAVQSVKATPGVSEKSLERKIAVSVEHERELVIGPRFFHDVCKSIPRITGAEILRKHGSDNELTRYRYDALLRVERDHVPAFPENERLALAPADLKDADDGRLATDPMAAAYLQQLGMKLANTLQTQIPSGQLPSAVVALSRPAFAALREAPLSVPTLRTIRSAAPAGR